MHAYIARVCAPCRNVSRRILTKVHFTEERTRTASPFSFSLPSLSLSSLLGNPGYTLAAAAPRSALRVQGGANLQRVGASRRSQAWCHCLATVAHREERERERAERVRETERSGRRPSWPVGWSIRRLFSDDVFAYRPVYI
jgi:hypothetical protein